MREKNMKKKILFFCMLMTVILGTLLPVHPARAESYDDLRASISYIGVGVDGNEMIPYKNTPCPWGNGICQMKSSGNGWIIDASNGATVVDYGCAWQCQNCNSVIVTQNDPLVGSPIGTYGFWHVNYKINKNGCKIRLPHDQIYYTSSTHIEGYHFIY